MKALAIAAALATLANGPVLAQAPPPPEAYGQLPSLSDAAISPDGRRVILAEAANGQSAFRVIDLAAGTLAFGARAEQGTDLRGVGWADDRRATFLASFTLPASYVAARQGSRFRRGDRFLEYFRVGIVDLPVQRHYYLDTAGNGSPFQIGITNLTAPIDGDPGFGRTIGWSAATQPSRLVIFRIDLANGRTTGIVHSRPNAFSYLIDEAGRPVARTDSVARTNEWRIVAYDGDADRVVERNVSDTGEPPELLGLFPDGRAATLHQGAGNDRQALYALDLHTGARTFIHGHDRYDIEDAILDPWTRRVVGAFWIEDLPRQRFFEPALEEIAGRARAMFPDGYASIRSWSRDRTRFLIEGERASDGGGFYIFTPADNRLALLGLGYRRLHGEADIGRRQSITYRARDGTRIPAYLTLPAGAEARNLPLVLLVHGGPHERDYFAFDWWASFLASRGYAVLQPNFRGSTGYGDRWFAAGRRQWGGLMQTDVEDGVAALVRAGTADAARVCIVGGSYGGYAALAGATLTPERYACAVSVAGISDLARFLARREATYGARSAESDYWRLSIGDRAEDRERIRAVSPVFLAANARAPILLMHGEEDTVVPIEQSRIMERALRAAGKTVRFVELRGDDHWLSRAQTRTQMLTELERFLAEHLQAR